MNDLNFKDLVAKAKALPTKTKNIIYLVFGIFIFILVYMFGFQTLQSTNLDLQSKIDTQSKYVNELKGYYNNIQTYETGIANDKKDIDEALSTLPAGINSEDFLMYIKLMCENEGLNLVSVSFSDDSFVGEFPCVVDEKSVTLTGVHAGADFSANGCTYAELKNVLNYIYERTREVTFIDSIGIQYNENANLDVTFRLSKYYATYDGSEYIPVPVPFVDQGTSNPFGAAS